MNSTQKNLMLVGCVTAVVVPAAFLLYLWTAPQIDRGTTPKAVCLNNLRRIDAAMQEWGIDHHKTTNDVPSWDDIRVYLSRLGRMPICPAGGTYTLGRLGEPPKCSYPQHILQ